MSPESLRAAESGPHQPQPDYLTPRELAEMLRVSEPTVYRWASEDATMPALRLGKTLRFPRERLLRWLRDLEQGRGRPRTRRQVLAVANPTTDQEAASG